MALDKLGGNSFSTGAIANSLGYTPANKAGDTFTGGVTFSQGANIQKPTGKQLTLAQWGDLSSADGGQSLFAGNAYVDKANGAFTYSNDHGSIGATGVRLNSPSWNQGSLWTAGTTSSTNGATFSPVDVLVWDQNGLVQLPKGQLKFPATQNPSSDPNTLDDYEEGTWTPTAIRTYGTGSVTSGASYGMYVKVGKQVTCWFFLTVTTSGVSGTNIGISGLPFVVSSSISSLGNFNCGCARQDSIGGYLFFLESAHDNQIDVMRRYDNNAMSDGTPVMRGFFTYATN